MFTSALPGELVNTLLASQWKKVAGKAMEAAKKKSYRVGTYEMHITSGELSMPVGCLGRGGRMMMIDG